MRFAGLAGLVVASCTFVPPPAQQPGDGGPDGAPADAHEFKDAPAPMDGSGSGQEGFAVVQQVIKQNKSAGTITATFMNPPAAGHVVMLVGGDSKGQGTAVSGIGTWTFVTGAWSDVDVEVWWTIGDGQHTDVTLSYGSDNMSPIFMSVTELAGIDAASPVDVSSSKSGSGNTTARPGPVTTTVPDVVFLAVASDSDMAFTTPTGETALMPVNVPGQPNFGPSVIGTWYEPGSAAGTYNLGVVSPGPWDGSVVALKLQ